MLPTLPALEGLRIVAVDRDPRGTVVSVRALVIDEDDVMAQSARLWETLEPDPAERGALLALREVATLPRTRDEITASCTRGGLSEEDASQGLELALAHALVKQSHVADFQTDFFFNDFLWGEDINRTTAALAGLPPGIRENLGALLEELHRHEGRPLEEVESAPSDLIKMAVVHGLIERTEITTSTGKKGTFHFTPRFLGFGVSRDEVPDALDQIRLVIASFAFATRYARFRLDNPELFLQRLIERGEAGNATPIGTDYGALERQKIVEVARLGNSNRYQFKAVKKDPLVRALDTMRAGALLRPAAGSGDGTSLLHQSFNDPVATRLRLGEQAGRTPAHDAALLAAIRDAAQGDRF